jgi:hypothetical protein
MTEVRCPWEECHWNIGGTCERQFIILTNQEERNDRYDPNMLECDQYEPE